MGTRWCVRTSVPIPLQALGLSINAQLIELGLLVGVSDSSE